MLNCVTGVPGASKTAYVVTQLYSIEQKNKINLKKNIAIFEHNKKYFEQFKDDFSYYEYEVGSGHTLKKELKILPPEYFYMLGQDFDDLRPDDYYLRSVQFNEIIERIRDRGEKEDFAFFQPVRTIYTNIKALKIDYARDLVIDWRTCPDGSIIVIDEVQLVPPYNANKSKDDPIVQELTIHRHRGFDFWFITQSPSYLHPTIKELISCHLHITRPYWRTPKIYQYGSLRAYPNTLINKLNCESKFNFKPKDFIFKLYKSTSIDTSKKRFPMGLIGFGVFVLLALSVFIYGLSSGSGFMGHFFGSEEKINASKNTPNSSHASSVSSVPASSDQTPVDLSLECRKAVNVEKPECVKWFDDLSENGMSVNQQSAAPQYIIYNANDPYNVDLSSVPLQVVDYPRLTGCAKKPTGEIVGIDQQGNIMPNLNKSACKKWLNGERLFDYTKQPTQVNNNAPVPNQTNNTESNQLSIQEMEKIEQALTDGLI